jgi:tRNA uridine 5-carbamoylmethylation protein Kti12
LDKQDRKTKMKMILLRGVSGSGKTTLAIALKKEALDKGQRCIICSADDYFIHEGIYRFDHNLLSQAHAWCRGKTIGALEAGVDLVIIDNTNLRLLDCAVYEKLAEQFCVTYQVAVVGKFDDDSLNLYSSRNMHGVSFKKIKRMASTFQK